MYYLELVNYNSRTTKERGWRIYSFIFNIFKARSSFFSRSLDLDLDLV